MAIESIQIFVNGVHTEEDVKEALQALYDVFAEQGLGQATFETTPDGPAKLFIKHKAGITPDIRAIDEALGTAGNFGVVI